MSFCTSAWTSPLYPQRLLSYHVRRMAAPRCLMLACSCAALHHLSASSHFHSRCHQSDVVAQSRCIASDAYPVTHHTSRITHHTSRITHHTSRITHHTSRITHHTSRITHHISRITHHTSRITHHTSRITHHTCVRRLYQEAVCHLPVVMQALPPPLPPPSLK
jgi:uncharacterized protein YoxC